MERKRDSQRSKVYAAESAWKRQMFPSGEVKIELQDCDILVTTMIQRYRPIADVHVTDGRGCRTAWCRAFERHVTICLPRKCRKMSTLCHEAAHGIALNERHGPAFCRAMIALVKHHMGERAAGKLVEQYQAYRVVFTEAQEQFKTKRTKTQQEIINGFEMNHRRRILNQLATPELYQDLDHEEMFTVLMGLNDQQITKLWFARSSYFDLMEHARPDRWALLQARAKTGLIPLDCISTSSKSPTSSEHP